MLAAAAANPGKLLRVIAGLAICCLSLAACGGGGGGGGSADDSGNDGDESEAVAFESEYFALVEKAFDDFLGHDRAPPGEDPVGGILKVFDANGDGFPDLLHSTAYFRWGFTGQGESYALINYYQNDRDGKFVNRTLEVFGSQESDAAARKIKFRDINGDGIDDIFMANNREDGRSNVNGNIAVANDIYLSQADGSFANFAVGDAAWSHDVGIGDIDKDGTFEFIDGHYGFPGSRVYDINPDGSWVESTAQTQNIGAFDANSSLLEDFDGDGCLDLFATSPWPDHQNRSYYLGDCAGGFALEEEFDLGTPLIDIPGQAWNGDPTIFRIAELNGQWVANFANFWSHAADFDNDGDLDILYAIETFAVTDEERADNLVIEGGDFFNLLVFLRNTPGGFVRLDNPIPDYPPDLQLYWSTVADVNGDGYLDLVVDNAADWQNRRGLNDSVFLNNGEGRFRQPEVSLAEGSVIDAYMRAVPVDVNRDGIMDFVLRSLSSFDNDGEYFKLLIGKKPLPDNRLRVFER